MSNGFYQRILFPLLTLPDAETSHNSVLKLLSLAQRAPALLRALETLFTVDDPRLHVSAFGLQFPNPVGLAAGFDKNGIAAQAIAALGFGHVEVGTVTPRPQPGKPKPRLYRLKPDRALINRLGFPSQGMAAVASNLQRIAPGSYVLGVNVGPNAASVESGSGLEDFVAGYRALAPLAAYVTINVSSPNTAGLRAMQQVDLLEQLLAGLDAGVRTIGRPLLVKIAPDLSDDEVGHMVDVIRRHAVAGIIATNTTVERPATLRSPESRESGGLSGAPLSERATSVVRRVYRLTEGKLPIVGVGGVAGSREAIDKLEAGASLVQLYTGFIYQGPGVARSINRGILAHLEKAHLDSVADLVGSRA